MSTLAALATVRRSWDADAGAYLKAVEVADGQQLELTVAQAINQFVLGCKADGVWDPIKASCILMGARTLSGALTPLVGTAPTNSNFVSGDYARKTGLVGNGTTKYLTSNRAHNADGQNDFHLSVYAQSFGSAGSGASPAVMIGWTISTSPFKETSGINRINAKVYARNREDNATFFTESTGFLGTSRSASASHTFRVGGANNTVTATSVALTSSQSIEVFAYGRAYPYYSTARLAFYSIGTAVTLASLDSRVSTLYTAIGNAI